MDFKALLLLMFISAGSCTLRGPPVINGTLAESVTVHLQYDQADEDYTKTWCKVIYGLCVNITDTAGYVNNLYLGRVSITDDKSTRTISITLHQLKKEDAGQYLCGILLSQLNYATFEVELKILEASPTSAPNPMSTNLNTELSPKQMKWNFVFLVVVLYLSSKLLAAVIIFCVLLNKHRVNGETAKSD